MAQRCRKDELCIWLRALLLQSNEGQSPGTPGVAHVVRPGGRFCFALSVGLLLCGVVAFVLFVRDQQTHTDWGQAKLVMGSKGPELSSRDNIFWQKPVLCVFFSHEAACCGLFRSPCHGKCSSKDEAVQTARLGLASLLTCNSLFRALQIKM